MSDFAPFSYTEDELRSYLPTGWTLAGDPTGDWNSSKKTWTTEVEDGADLRWDLVIREDDARKDRLGALRTAMDKLFRERLGRTTKGLGF